MDAQELAWWEAYYTLFPFPADRVDLGAAQIVARILDLFRGEGEPATNPLDVCPDWGGLREEARQRDLAGRARRGALVAEGWRAWGEERRQAALRRAEG